MEKQNLKNKKSALIVGDGGLARVLYDIIEAGGNLHIEGFIGQADGNICGLPVYNRCDLNNIPTDIPLILGMLRPTYRQSSVIGFGENRFLSVLDGFISSFAKIAQGCVVMLDSYVMNNAKINSYVHVHTSAIVGHDCEVGEYSFIGPGCVLGGYSKLGSRCRLGMGVKILPGLVIDDDVTAAAGAVITKNVEAGVVVGGNPAHNISKTDFNRF